MRSYPFSAHTLLYAFAHHFDTFTGVFDWDQRQVWITALVRYQVSLWEDIRAVVPRPPWSDFEQHTSSSLQMFGNVEITKVPMQMSSLAHHDLWLSTVDVAISFNPAKSNGRV
jgi:hypothetical protein